MHLSQNLCALAVRQLLGGACKMIALGPGEEAIEGVVAFLSRHFLDHSQRLGAALRRSNDSAWRALEVALAGDSLLDRCKVLLARGEDKAFREQVQPFLAACPLGELHGRDAFRALCLAELKAARKAGLLTEGTLDPIALARQAGAFARYREPQQLLDAEYATLGQMGTILRAAGHGNLAEFVSL